MTDRDRAEGIAACLELAAHYPEMVPRPYALMAEVGRYSLAARVYMLRALLDGVPTRCFEEGE